MPRNSIDVSQFPIVPNPWGINRRGAALLDRYIEIGDMAKTAAALGYKYGTATTALDRALEKIPGSCKLHKLIYWRDFRGLVPSSSVRPSSANPFGTTGLQAMAIDLSIAGFPHAKIAEQMGRSTRSVSDHIRQGLAKVPGGTHAQRLAAWRQFREDQKRDPS